MKAKIVSCEHPDYWYSESIGEIFEVLEVKKDTNNYVASRGKIMDAMVKIDDCIIIEE